MQTLIEFAPLVAFLIAYRVADIYAATATLMVAMLALLAFDFARTRRIPPMHGISAALVLIFGGATLLLHDERFIIWNRPFSSGPSASRFWSVSSWGNAPSPSDSCLRPRPRCSPACRHASGRR